ncbi:MAG: DNA repair protein RadA [Flavobacteriales bacterium]|jgi:DNA repair protein RadA/Sms|nr:DNA repair protein RadA [Flavobacteriales bacterium]|tara:strand:- start:694 stop:2055 length:1362 start_codon:yes stop_codon:yes gene_type:complete
MAKTKTTFFCQNCGAQSPQWMGKCKSCNEWNTIIEEVVSKPKKSGWESESPSRSNKAQPISEISLQARARIDTSDNELNRVLGGGIVAGSIILLGGEPGIGKSTLLLQVALRIKNEKLLYVTGEESDQQIRMRADRLNQLDSSCQILTETNTQNIFQQIQEVQPSILVVDSIQTLQTNTIDSSPGSISQIRECTSELMSFAKSSGVPVLLIGHINKDGNIAGPKILEHMVDVVLQFEGDRNHVYRILRANKNRYGSTSELGIYEMQSDGLREVANPSEILLSQKDEDMSGIAVSATLEGMRPLMIETQALVSSAVYGTPQRSATGFDLRRLSMLLAVLEKRCGFRLGAKDVFLNITGGIKVDDPAIDLGVVCAILSSNVDMAINDKDCFAAEVGLSGEIRPVNRCEQRIQEAQKLGFERIYISKYNKINPKNYNIEIVMVGKIEEVFKKLFAS